MIHLLKKFRLRLPFMTSAALVVSLIFHVTLLVLIGGIVIFEGKLQDAGFEAADFFGGDESDARPELVEPEIPSGGDVGGTEEFLEEMAAPLHENQDFTSVAMENVISSTQISPSALITPARVSLPKGVVGGSAVGLAGLGKKGRGFSPGSGLGQSIGDWIGSGKQGIGISGRGKTLKTVNEFWCYFVIHSGDWYAALDWRPAPGPRNKESNYPSLPDQDNMLWYETDPADYEGVGPFVAYHYGFVKYKGKKFDDRYKCVEFTPGAMSNLLQFIRVASNDAIKGGKKPKAVVLDRDMLPYRYDKDSGEMTWFPEGRESLRRALRDNLPAGDKYSQTHGYLWNPQPDDPDQMDFLVEYLLDVKPMPPFIYFTGNDSFRLSDAEVETLNEYVRRGGAVWGDSGFAGHRSKFDVAFRREMKRVIPDEDKPFKALPNDASNMFLAGADAYFDFTSLPYGMQYYQSPVEVIELRPGLVSVVLTKNAYGNFLRYEMTRVNNQFQIGGEQSFGMWTEQMWEYRSEFFRGLGDQNIQQAYFLGTNILVYMLGRWPTALQSGGF